MRPKQVSDEDMLKKTKAVFLKQGPQASTETIAEELGISQAAIFKRFKTKKELMIAALAPKEMPPWIGRVARRPDGKAFKKQLAEILEDMLSFFQEMAPVFHVLKFSGIPPADLLGHFKVPPPLVALREISAWLERCAKKKLIKKTDFQVTATIIMGSMHFNSAFKILMGKAGSTPFLNPPKKFIPELVGFLDSNLKPRGKR